MVFDIRSRLVCVATTTRIVAVPHRNACGVNELLATDVHYLNCVDAY